ncbi:hypothetical protein SLEP1_g4895 [Rubroshorea leprosula]|uniref:Transmembrane protein n=1 Tax=Rubroshorea leprosula TaxID=152421 RepID=A0AAV5HZ07_9ROSI|nr:hypothetical protein SLEP1_g4895 [Rubroshorea leprosula]
MEKKGCGVVVRVMVVLMLVDVAIARIVTDQKLNKKVRRNMLTNSLGMTPPMGKVYQSTIN